MQITREEREKKKYRQQQKQMTGLCSNQPTGLYCLSNPRETVCYRRHPSGHEILADLFLFTADFVSSETHSWQAAAKSSLLISRLNTSKPVLRTSLHTPVRASAEIGPAIALHCLLLCRVKCRTLALPPVMSRSRRDSRRARHVVFEAKVA